MAEIRSKKLNKSVFGGHDTVRVAAIQAPQIVFNKEKSIEVACDRIKEAGVYCVMGVNELNDVDGSRTLYNTQILFGPDGSILRRHRKLMPTFNERLYHGLGDGSDLGV